MARYAEPMARLIEELKKLPGVGTKTAQRFAFHILRSSDEDASALAEAVRGLKASLRLCSICNNITDVDPCAYCSQPHAQSTPGLRGRGAHQYRCGGAQSIPAASITFCMEHYRRCMASDPISCAGARWFSVWSAAKWTKSFLPPAPPWKARPPPAGWPSALRGIQGAHHADRHGRSSRQRH